MRLLGGQAVVSDIVGEVKDTMGRTWQEAFYIQTKAFLEKNSEHIKEIESLKAEVRELKFERVHDLNHIGDLQAENARLKAENARLKAEVEAVRQEYSDATNHYNRLHNDLQAEVDRLTKQKAVFIDNEIMVNEMERLKAEVKEKTALISELHKDAEISYRESMSDEYDLYENTKIINGLMRDKEKLQAQVERLTKAGDNLVYVVTEHPVAEPFVKAWFAAKEGKQ
jgi:cell division protein FtsB